MGSARVVTPFSQLFLLFCFSVAGSKADLQEKNTEIEVDEVFWNTRIVPILHDLEKGKKKKVALDRKYLQLFICSPLPWYFQYTLSFFLWTCSETSEIIYLPSNVCIQYYM